MRPIKRVVMIGPESTGKTEMAEYLASCFNDLWMPEFAREYVEKLQRPYIYNDVEIIARKQVELETEFARKAKHCLFIDTDLIITKVWFDIVFKLCPSWVVESIQKMPRDLYLLFKPDIPWVYDGVRENSENREKLFEIYQQELNIFGFPYKVIEGKGQARFLMGKEHVDSCFYSHI